MLNTPIQLRLLSILLATTFFFGYFFFGYLGYRDHAVNFESDAVVWCCVMTPLILSELLIYPIKSAAGISVASADLTARGLRCDRRYMIVNNEGHFLTQRRYPKMALIRVTVPNLEQSSTQLSVTAPGMDELPVSAREEGDAIEVDVWGDRTSAIPAGPDAQAWFTQYLSTPCQLVHMPDAAKRPTEHGKFGDREIVSFADAYPYLLLTEASLAGLNQKLVAKQAEPVPMNRFRPNLVVSGDLPPHAEDSWKKIRIGSAVFTVDKPCARCAIPNVNQSSGDRTTEPSQTLATYRAWDKGIWFGQNLIQEKAPNQPCATLHVGDPVEILA